MFMVLPTRMYLVELSGPTYDITKGLYTTWDKALERAKEIESDQSTLDNEVVRIASVNLDSSIEGA